MCIRAHIQTLRLTGGASCHLQCDREVGGGRQLDGQRLPDSPPDAKPVVKISLADFWADVEAFKPVVEPMPVEQQHARGSPPVTPRPFHASPAGSSSTSSGAPTSSSPGPMLGTSQIAAALSKLKSTAQAM